MEYEASNIWMKKYSAAKSNEIRARLFNNNPDYLEKIEENSGRYDIKTIPFNSAESDFAPSFNGDQLIFSTARDSGTVTQRIHEWNNKAFLNLYASNASADGEFTTTEKFSNGLLNGKTHESSTAFTKDGTKVYFTRNNSGNGNFKRDEEGVSRLKIYSANQTYL